MTRVIFYTATTLNGYLADDQDSLSWLFSVPGADDAEGDITTFLGGIGALVMGSTTYEWVLEHENLTEHPDKWAYGRTPTFVMTTRSLPSVSGADVRLRAGAVGGLWDEIVEAAGGLDVWVVGGGDLAGQFADAKLLDEIRVSIAPVTLASGRPLFPRRIESDALHLESARQAGQFAELVYSLRRATEG